MHKLRYIYLRDTNNAPVSCLATALNKDKKKVLYAVSVLNPQDRFNRGVARDIAVGRLITAHVEIDLSDVEELNCHIITRRILTDLLTWDHSELPGRARKAAKKWLLDNPPMEEEEAKTRTAVFLSGGPNWEPPHDISEVEPVVFDHDDKKAFARMSS